MRLSFAKGQGCSSIGTPEAEIGLVLEFGAAKVLCPARNRRRLLPGLGAVKTCNFNQDANRANLCENQETEDSMPRQTRSKHNIRTQNARLRKSATELTRLAKRFAIKWDGISNEGRVAIERSTARSLRAAGLRVNRTNKRMGEILDWLDQVRRMEKLA